MKKTILAFALLCLALSAGPACAWWNLGFAVPKGGGGGAIVWETFEADAVGAAPAAFTRYWSGNFNRWAVYATGTTLSPDKHLDLQYNVNPKFGCWDSVPAHADGEYLFRFISQSLSYQLNWGVRCDTASENGYVIYFDDFFNRVGLRKWTAGVQSGDLAVSAGIVLNGGAGSAMRARFQVQGWTFRGRVWDDGAAEPGVWHFEYTDAGQAFASGRCGFATIGGVGNQTYVHTVGYSATLNNPAFTF